MAILDSGTRRQFESGAVRDVSDDKGRMDFIPISILRQILSSSIPKQAYSIDDVLQKIDTFIKLKDCSSLIDAFVMFQYHAYDSLSTGILEQSIHFLEGASKYSAFNWCRGMPLHCYIDSALRHLVKYVGGWVDEPHDRSFGWNLLCGYWTYVNIPELDDLISEHDYLRD